MSWLLELPQTNPTAQAIALLSLVCLLGMSLGGLSVGRVKLGTSGVLFAAILVGQWSAPVDHRTLEFVKEFGLILFVFCLGLQLGPGFFASFRQAGLRWNLLALATVVGGAVTAAGLGWLCDLDGAAVLGIFSGATTNTPSLGAAEQTLSTFPQVSRERAALPALAYAVTYPLGVVGIIGSLLVLKTLLRIDVRSEVAADAAAQGNGGEPLERRTLVIENPNLRDLPLEEIPALAETGVVISRILPAGHTEVVAATSRRLLRPGDRLLAVGSAHGLDQVQRVVGRASSENLLTAPGALAHRRVVVTNAEVLGRAIRDLHLDLQFGVTVTRVVRGDLEMTAVPGLALQFGDVLQVVGPLEAIRGSAQLLGNSLEALNQTHFVPLFAGISLGIVLGTLPIPCPGLSQPLRLGLAGGPLIVAIVLGRIGRVGRLVWHLPRSANLAFRELGIALFFAAVGLLAGPGFFTVATSQAGIEWLLVGIGVTVVPLVAVGLFARWAWGMNFVAITGLLAGSMTDPPALAFANSLTQSESPAVAYATVYPLTMLVRILTAQILALLLCG